MTRRIGNFLWPAFWCAYCGVMGATGWASTVLVYDFFDGLHLWMSGGLFIIAMVELGRYRETQPTLPSKS